MTIENFDYCAEQYDTLFDCAWIKYCDNYTLLQELGDLRGKSVLDVGCGEGYFSRLVKRLGAESVMGVDLSEKMIDIAKRKEAREGLGISYACKDLTQLDLPGQRFDVVICSFVLSLAGSTATLLKMFKSIFAHLKPGGRLHVADDNLELPPEMFHIAKQYHFTKRVEGGVLREGAAIRYELETAAGLVEIEANYIPRTTWEQCLRATGFSHWDWRPLQISPDGMRECGEDYWRDYLRGPISINLVAVR